jgi:C1A family cysteine protease
MILVLGTGLGVAVAQSGGFGLKIPPFWNLLGTWDADSPSPGVLPSRFVWTELFPGKPARSQGNCGSCWAFATVGVVEYQVQIYERRDVDLSEQWLLDCIGGGNGCNGGFQSYNYFLHGISTDGCGQNGAVLESALPYLGTNGTCACPYSHHYWLQGWSYIGFPLQLQASRDQLKRAIYLFGPISSSVFATNWPTGPFTHVLNDCRPDFVDHMVLIVGWSDALGAWRIRNSWGADWGDNGEAWIAYECSSIGFGANYVTYPTGRGVYVDFNYNGFAGGERGLFNQPFNTLQEGVNALDPGGTLSVKAGSTSTAITLAKAMTVKVFGGPVTIGR